MIINASKKKRAHWQYKKNSQKTNQETRLQLLTFAGGGGGGGGGGSCEYARALGYVGRPPDALRGGLAPLVLRGLHRSKETKP